jgi:N-acetylmuramoyl-L-alanine amidase
MPVTHVVRPGDCLSLIAFEHGHIVETVWNAPENEELRKLRGTPYVLAEGDSVFVPDLRRKSMECATGARHVFRRREVPEIFRLELRSWGAARAGLAYAVTFRAPSGETSYSGTTDDQGGLQHFIPPNATGGTLTIGEDERYELQLAHLAPLSTDRGVRQRLFNLGYLAAQDGDDDALRAAVAAFQEEGGLKGRGTLTDETREALQKAHGS